ncbi:LysR family transcriptional regulator [Acinetobacter baylyi]|uniref:LysR family transcriptional regulator n=1 Tax=Acinetobacter baylyi TaxID=202950 RepID=UPI000EA1624E|nr:LysR family transcriptional regulator [Acinetobacter baylyi]
MRFDGLDLNLLVALDILLSEKNITKAGEKLFLSQPATSAALARLRDYFEDDLLVQIGRSMVLTPMGESLAKPVKDLLIQTRTLLNNRHKFDPLTSDRTFTIMASDYTGSVLLPELNRKLAEYAPHCSIEQIMPSSEAEKQIQRGNVDILLLPSVNIIDEHPSTEIFNDEFVCVMWDQNSLSNKEMTLQDYKNAQHVMVRLGTIYNTPMIDDWLIRNLNFERKVGYVTINFSSVPLFLIGTPYIAIMHKRLADIAAKHLPIHICQLPWETPKINIYMQWNKFQETDPGLVWLRDLIMETASYL